MRSSAVITLFAASAAAQSSAVLLNPLLPAPTFTVLGSSSGTTTYVNSCSEGAGIPVSYLSSANTETSGSKTTSSVVSSVAGDVVMTPMSAPSTTAAARLRRQDNFLGVCETITIKQGSSSMELHMQDPTEGVWTVDMNCAWKGELTAADLTCTATQSGSFAKVLEAEGVTSTTFGPSDAASVLQTVSVVHATSNSAPNSTPATVSGSQSSSAKATASGSGAPEATGAAAGTPLSNGVMAFVGGAAGVFAAALAL